MRQIKRHLVFKRHDVCNRASSPTPLAPLGETRVSPRIANFHFDHRHQHRNHQSRHCASQKPPATMNLSIIRPVFRPYKTTPPSQPTNIWQRTAQQTCRQPPKPQRATFSTTPCLQKRSKKGPGNDPRISTSPRLPPPVAKQSPSPLSHKTLPPESETKNTKSKATKEEEEEANSPPPQQTSATTSPTP